MSALVLSAKGRRYRLQLPEYKIIPVDMTKPDWLEIISAHPDAAIVVGDSTHQIMPLVLEYFPGEIFMLQPDALNLSSQEISDSGYVQDITEEDLFRFKKSISIFINLQQKNLAIKYPDRVFKLSESRYQHPVEQLVAERFPDELTDIIGAYYGLGRIMQKDVTAIVIPSNGLIYAIGDFPGCRVLNIDGKIINAFAEHLKPIDIGLYKEEKESIVLYQDKDYIFSLEGKQKTMVKHSAFVVIQEGENQYDEEKDTKMNSCSFESMGTLIFITSAHKRAHAKVYRIEFPSKSFYLPEGVVPTGINAHDGLVYLSYRQKKGPGNIDIYNTQGEFQSSMNLGLEEPGRVFFWDDLMFVVDQKTKQLYRYLL